MAAAEEKKVLFRVKQKSHNDIIGNQLSIFYDNQAFADVTLSSNGEDFKVHRIVLSVQSEYFYKIFKNNDSENRTIYMNDTDPAVIKQMLQFMYKGAVMLTRNEYTKFRRLANMLKINGIDDSHPFEQVGSLNNEKSAETNLQGGTTTGDVYDGTASAIQLPAEIRQTFKKKETSLKCTILDDIEREEKAAFRKEDNT